MNHAAGFHAVQHNVSAIEGYTDDINPVASTILKLLTFKFLKWKSAWVWRVKSGNHVKQIILV